MAANDSCELIDVAPELLERWLANGEAVLVDVREDFEHASERIDAAKHHALSKFDCDQLRVDCDGKRIVFHCRTGGRSAQAAAKLGDEQVFHLCGGIEAWKALGLPVHRSASAPTLDVMRQVQIIAGLLILTGVVLGFIVNPMFFGISAFVGCGLTFAGLSGWCGMAFLLGRMPWNRGAAVNCPNCADRKTPDLATDF